MDRPPRAAPAVHGLDVVLLVLLFGGLAIARLQRDILPNIDIPWSIVVWNYPGLSADDMEKRVVYITERALSTTVNGISRIESQSLSGIGIVRVYFEEGTDIGSAIAQISSVCNTILRVLPPGIHAAHAPAVQRLQRAGGAAHGRRRQTSPSRTLFDYGLNFLRVRLFTIPGLSTPAPYGGRQRQVMVDVDPRRVRGQGRVARGRGHGAALAKRHPAGRRPRASAASTTTCSSTSAPSTSPSSTPCRSRWSTA